MKRKPPLTFEQATLKAASYDGHNEKLCRRLKRASNKSKRHYESLLASWESFQIFFRMIRAWMSALFPFFRG